MKKKTPFLQLIVITVFFGILLSCTVTHVVNLMFSPAGSFSSTCYDGSSFEGSGPISVFHRAVYQNENSLAFVRKLQYRLFGNVSDAGVIGGKNDFLFEIWNEKNGYNYLQDYTDGTPFTVAEQQAVLDELIRREALCEQHNAYYMLVVIPNAQTVYHNYMPRHLGNISQNTRLETLEQYLYANDFSSFVDLTEALRDRRSDGLLYNNTENSLNALGLYYAYSEVCRRINPDNMEEAEVVPREALSFYQHQTTGKSIARRAGLEDVVQNRTVSLSNSTPLDYTFSLNEGRFATTILPQKVGTTPNLLLQFSGNWERLQSEPFFSNTFDMVTYQTDLSLEETAFETATPHIVVQFLYEYELSALLPR